MYELCWRCLYLGDTVHRVKFCPDYVLEDDGPVCHPSCPHEYIDVDSLYTRNNPKI